jgi:hypothetical protein
MSLLNDPSTRHLWHLVQSPGSYENAAQSLWNRIFNKDVFYDRRYILDYEDPPTIEQQGQRKVDQTVKVYNSDWGMLLVLLFHEIKRKGCTAAELEHAEKQAFDACESYCLKYNIPNVYAQTSIGSRARFWRFTKSTRVWEALDDYPLGDFRGYCEIGDPNGETYILDKYRTIKSEGPQLPHMYVLDPVLKAFLTKLAESGSGMQHAT